jgi:hypothetical protein
MPIIRHSTQNQIKHKKPPNFETQDLLQQNNLGAIENVKIIIVRFKHQKHGAPKALKALNTPYTLKCTKSKNRCLKIEMQIH